MQRLTSAELDHRLNVVVDPDADPVDQDAALARFLLSYVRNKRSRSSPAAPAVEQDEHHGLVDTADMED